MSDWVGTTEVLHTRDPSVYAVILWSTWKVVDTSMPCVFPHGDAADIRGKSLSGFEPVRAKAKEAAEHALRVYIEYKASK